MNRRGFFKALGVAAAGAAAAPLLGFRMSTYGSSAPLVGLDLSSKKSDLTVVMTVEEHLESAWSTRVSPSRFFSEELWRDNVFDPRDLLARGGADA